MLVVNGRMRIDELRRNAVSRETIYGQVRACGYVQLGQVARIYLEPSGAFTVVPAQPVLLGLPVVPAADNRAPCLDDAAGRGLHGMRLGDRTA